MDEFIDWLMREETICDVGLAQRQLEVDVKNQWRRQLFWLKSHHSSSKA